MIVLQGHRHRVEAVRFSPDGAAVLAPTRRGIQVWRPFTTPGAPEVIDAPFVSRFQLTPDGRTLFAASGRLDAFDLDAGTSAEVPLWNSHGVYFALSHRGDRLVVGQNRSGGHRMAGRSAGGILLWERPVDPWWWVHPLFVPGDEEFVRVEYETGGHRRAEYRIVTHAAETGEELCRSDPLAAEVRDWVMSPDGATVACRITVRIHVYPLRDSFRKPLATLRNDNRKEFTGVAFHPSGKYLAATSNDTTVKLYDTATWEVARTFTWDIGRMRSVAFSPDGTLAAAGSDTGKVVVWDVDV